MNIFQSARAVLLASVIFTIAGEARAAEVLRGETLTLTVREGRYTIQVAGQSAPFATGALRSEGAVKIVPVADDIFGRGEALHVTAADGSGESFLIFRGLPFVLHRSVLVNTGEVTTVLNKMPLMDAVLDLGKPADQLAALGTGGLKPLGQNVGSYAWMAVADPSSGSGVVGGWLTHEQGSGVVFSRLEGGKANLEARLEYGRLQIEPGKSVVSETFIIGWFADARLGLEAWADAVAKQLRIQLPPMPTVYCTWYDNVHGRAGNAASLAELSAFATKALKPYGLTCLQIDDGWQRGDPQGNGPRKNFSAHDPKGPYPLGMKPTAQTIQARGFTAGLWILPFGGTWNDPFFAPHQDWFVKKPDGSPFDTAWGGTALDMTQPGARSFVEGEIKQAVHDWGYNYLKLDGLSTGIGVKPQYVNDAWKEDNLGEGVFNDPSKPHVQVFRDGLRMIRQAAGPKTFILGCCAPQNMRSYAGVFGLVDGMRMGPDNSGSWAAWKRTSPDFGSRNYHLHGRIWWSDPDPIYVRSSIPLESARCIASWNAIAGQMISLSDWLPTLPAERLEIIRRCIPGHGVTARPIELFNAWPPPQWLVTDLRADRQRRDVVGLFNWSNSPQTMSLDVPVIGLSQAEEYIAYDFWNQVFLKPFQGKLALSVPGAGCRILALRPMLPRPFLLSTSRHVSQGILEVSGESWDAVASTLAGTSAVVAEDVYELRVVARAPEAGWSLLKAEVAAADQTAGVTITATQTDSLVRAVIKSPVSREVAWSLAFASGKPAAASPVKIQAVAYSISEDGESVVLRWKPTDGSVSEVAVGQDPPIVVDTATCTLSRLEPGKESRVRLTPISWSGWRGEAVELTVTPPKAPVLPPVPPQPTVPLTSLKAIESHTGYGTMNANASVDGRPLSLGGVVYTNGIGLHAEATLVYEVKPEYRRFVAVAGIDDEKKESPASVVFKVIAEVGRQRKELAASPKLRAGKQPAKWHFDIAIPERCTRLRLVVGDAGDGINSDHADWVDAGFIVPAKD